MEIIYENRRIQKICTEKKTAQKELGQNGASVLLYRLDQLRNVDTLEELRFEPGHWHELIGDRWGQLAANLSGRTRLIFEPNHDPKPEKPDGGLDWKRVTVVVIVEVTDYH